MTRFLFLCLVCLEVMKSLVECGPTYHYLRYLKLSDELLKAAPRSSDFEQCPSGHFARGFALKVYKPKDSTEEVVTGVRLICGTGYVESNEGAAGEWRPALECEGPSRLHSWTHKVDAEGLRDLNMICTDGTLLEGFGQDTDQSPEPCAEHTYVCGLLTSVRKEKCHAAAKPLAGVQFKCCER